MESAGVQINHTRLLFYIKCHINNLCDGIPLLHHYSSIDSLSFLLFFFKVRVPVSSSSSIWSVLSCD